MSGQSLDVIDQALYLSDLFKSSQFWEIYTYKSLQVAIL